MNTGKKPESAGPVGSASLRRKVALTPFRLFAEIRVVREGMLPALLAMFVVTGCQLFETREERAPGPAGSQPEPAATEPEPVAPPELSTAMEYLEAGRGQAARAVLSELAKDAPGSPTLANLRRQIDLAPEELLPGPYRQVEVGPGDSLSVIAARELGDPLLFYALARLNGIEVPAQVRLGTVLRVPDVSKDEDEHEVNTGDSTASSAAVTVAEIETVAQYLARSGQGDQARAMLIGKLAEDGGNGAASTRELLAKMTLDDAAKMRAEGDYARGIEILDQTLGGMGYSPQRSELAAARDSLRSEMLRLQAIGLRDQGSLLEAYQAAQGAAKLDPASEEATELVGNLRNSLVDSLHNDALLAWRGRNVDLAIRTWESLLELAPDFEPARVYLERARLLRERLDEP